MKQTTLPSTGPNTTTISDPQQQANPTPTINTRRSAPTPTLQEIMQQTSEVKDALSGKNYLEKTALAISGKPYATNAISEILFHITQIKNVPLTAQTAIRAIAYILEEQTELKIAESVARHTITALAPHVAKIQEETTKLEKLTQDLNGTRNIGAQLESIQKAVDQVVLPQSGSEPWFEPEPFRTELMVRSQVRPRPRTEPL